MKHWFKMRKQRSYKKALIGSLCLLSLVAGGCSSEPQKVSNEPFIPTTVLSIEAEDGIFQGHVKAVANPVKSGYSGTGYVEGLEEDEDSLGFEVEIENEGFYDLDFISASQGGYKQNHVWLDGVSIGDVSNEKTYFTSSVLERVFLTKGMHIVEISKYWGWVYMDRLDIITSEPLDATIYEVDYHLSNPNASDSTKRLMSYLCDVYGEYFLSGQYCDTGKLGKEFTIINKETGKYPAVLGLDFIEYSPSRVSHGSTSKATDFAINFNKDGGIVTFCWHWNAPEKYLTDIWYKGFYKEGTTIDLEKIMNGEDEEGYKLLLEDIDAIAKQLLILQENDVPILWRPLHEASGGWFWWGTKGPEAYKKLYILLYEKLTNEYHLNNLIWLWNGQNGDWYPGDEYVDIIGEDIYPGERVYTSQIAKYLEAIDYTTAKKMVVLSENGCVFDPDLAIRDGAMWGFFCNWQGEFVAKEGAFYSLSEQYTEGEMFQKVYNHDKVITLDELPDLKNYPISEKFY